MSNTLFQRQTATVRDSQTVLVLREVLPSGVVLYRKRFKAQGFDIWAARENQFFSLFSLKKLQQVVRPETIKNTEHGAVSEVVTFDAGLTIEEWLQLTAVGREGQGASHVFWRGESFMRLAYACLQALQEIHAAGIIHCDIKPDNICLPYSPKDFHLNLAQPIQIEFEQIRLIDFSFSLSSDIPLENAVLPLDSRSSYAEYLAPAFKEALLADQKTGCPKQINTLDASVDLYSLGFMLSKLLARGALAWHQTSGEALAREMIVGLMSGSHDADHWLKLLAAWLHDAPTQQGVILAATQQHSPVTPVTPLLATPLVAPEINVESTVPAKKSFLSLAKKYQLWLGGLLAIVLISISWSLSRGISIEMVKIPGQAYELGRYEVTQSQWQDVMDSNPSQFSDCAKCPVESVNLEDIVVFLRKLKEQTGRQYRLPSSAEWEHACMAEQNSRYCGGDEIDSLAWHQANSEGRTHPVGSKLANAYGLYDMSGNVAEWVADCAGRDCSQYVTRGGSWFVEAKAAGSGKRSKQDEFQTTSQMAMPIEARGNNLGFRLARTIEP